MPSLPPNPNLDQLKFQAKDLLKAHNSAAPRAALRLRQSLPELAGLSDTEIFQTRFALKDAQRVIACEYGFDCWTDLKRHVESVSVGGEHFFFAEGALPEAIANLLRAVEAGDPDQVASLLQENPALIHTRIGGEMPEGDTLLHRSDPLKRKDGQDPDDPHLKVAQILIDHGADVDAIGGRGNTRNSTPLDAAAWAGNIGMVKLLLANGADPEKAAEGLRPPAWTAASHDRPEIFRLLVEAGAHYGLKHTIRLGLLRETQELLDADPTILNGTQEGEVPLILAAQKQDIFSFLLHQGADIHARDARGYTPLLAARAADNAAALQELRDRGVSDDIFGAIADGDAARVEVLLGADATVVHPMGEGEGPVPLVWAAFYGERRIVEVLLEHGADPNVVGESHTPLITAILRHNDDIVQLLLDHGADPEFAGKGDPPLAVARGTVQATRLLLDAGADPNRSKPWFAVWAGELERVKLLLDRGRIASEQQPDGGTGQNDLTVAAGNGNAVVKGNTAMLELLLCHGANLEYVGDRGLTAMQVAQKGLYPDAVELLNEHATIRRLPEYEAQAILRRRCQFVDAVVDGRAADVSRLLDAEPSLLDSHPARDALMKYAAMAGKDDVVDVMVDHGAPMEIQVAALLGRVSLVASMLEADPSLLDEGLLLAAVIRDQVEVVEFLLDRAKEGAGQPSIGVNTGLHAAIHHKHRALKTLKLLLARGADANFKNEWGGLPLQAFSTGSDLGGLRKEMCDLLIAHGANPEDQSNPTP